MNEEKPPDNAMDKKEIQRIVDKADEIISRLSNPKQISFEKCRQQLNTLFSDERMFNTMMDFMIGMGVVNFTQASCKEGLEDQREAVEKLAQQFMNCAKSIAINYNLYKHFGAEEYFQRTLPPTTPDQPPCTRNTQL